MNIKKLISTGLLTLALPLSAMAQQKIPAGTYNIDSMHSKVGFEIPHLVISTVEGRFTTFDGQIKVEDKIEKSKVTVNIETASVDTGVAKRDDHLKSAEFFDATKFPKMSFVSKKVTASASGMKILGTLKIKGISKDVTLDATYLGTVKDGYGQEKVAFKAKTKINRKEFGLTWGQVVEAGPIVGDEAEITLNIQATLAKK
jgi:polyisoprenoid-binding protein YceI